MITCDRCGAALDAGEKCDCGEETDIELKEISRASWEETESEAERLHIIIDKWPESKRIYYRIAARVETVAMLRQIAGILLAVAESEETEYEKG